MLFNILVTTKIISGWVPTDDSAQPWLPYSAGPLSNPAISRCCPTGKPGSQHHDLITQSVTLSWHWAILTPCPTLITPSTWLWSDKYQFHKPLIWLDHVFQPMISPACETSALPIQPPHLVNNQRLRLQSLIVLPMVQHNIAFCRIQNHSNTKSFP